jgi:hypothetical protein
MNTKLPEAVTAMPSGALNAARVPMPSANPAVPLPARVLSCPPATMRMAWFRLSEMYSAPLASMARPMGLLSRALSRGPLTNPAVPLPAKVPVVPLGHTWRMAWLSPPARKRMPEGARTPWRGWLKRTALGVAASAYPGVTVPGPASVLTAPPGVTARRVCAP